MAGRDRFGATVAPVADGGYRGVHDFRPADHAAGARSRRRRAHPRPAARGRGGACRRRLPAGDRHRSPGRGREGALQARQSSPSPPCSSSPTRWSSRACSTPRSTKMVGLCRRIGTAGLWILVALAGAASAFLNNTPIVVLSRAGPARCREVDRPLAQALPDPAVLRRRARRLLHPDRHVDQPARQRHGVGRRPAALRNVRDHARRGRRRACRRALSLPLQRTADADGRRAEAERRLPWRCRVRRAGPGRRPGRIGRSLLQAGAVPAAARSRVAGRVRAASLRSPRSTSRRSRPAPSPGRCC